MAPGQESLPAREQAEPNAAVAVSRALGVLDAFMGSDTQLTMSELARRVDLPKSTVHRLISQLTESGFLTRVDRRYQLSMHVLRLGNQHGLCRPGGMREIAAPHLAGLFQHTGFVVNLAVLEGSDVVYLDKIQGPRAPRSPAHVGGRMPALSTALGKAMVAHSEPAVVRQVFATGLTRRTPHSIIAPGLMRDQLLRIRDSGVAYDIQECMVGLTCVAAPVLSSARVPIAAISVSGPVVRLDPQAAAPLVIRAAALIAGEWRRSIAQT